MEVQGYTGGQWTLAATRRGLVRVRAAALAEVNALEGMSVFTLYDLQPVEAGETVAKAKITPLAIAGGAREGRGGARAAPRAGSSRWTPSGRRVLGALARESLEPRSSASASRRP